MRVIVEFLSAPHLEPCERFRVGGLPAIARRANDTRVRMVPGFRSAPRVRGILLRLTHAKLENRGQA